MQTIRAEITGNTCTAFGITAHGTAPVLALCRKLVETDHDPAKPLHAYRGDVVALKVRSIGEGARLRVAPHGVGFIYGATSDEQEVRPFAQPTEALPRPTLH